MDRVEEPVTSPDIDGVLTSAPAPKRNQPPKIPPKIDALDDDTFEIKPNVEQGPRGDEQVQADVEADDNVAPDENVEQGPRGDEQVQADVEADDNVAPDENVEQGPRGDEQVQADVEADDNVAPDENVEQGPRGDEQVQADVEADDNVAPDENVEQGPRGDEQVQADVEADDNVAPDEASAEQNLAASTFVIHGFQDVNREELKKIKPEVVLHRIAYLEAGRSSQHQIRRKVVSIEYIHKVVYFQAKLAAGFSLDEILLEETDAGFLQQLLDDILDILEMEDLMDPVLEFLDAEMEELMDPVLEFLDASPSFSLRGSAELFPPILDMP